METIEDVVVPAPVAEETAPDVEVPTPVVVEEVPVVVEEVPVVVEEAPTPVVVEEVPAPAPVEKVSAPIIYPDFFTNPSSVVPIIQNSSFKRTFNLFGTPYTKRKSQLKMFF